MSNSSFNQSQTGNATELGVGSVKLATQAQVDAKQADDGGSPLVVTPDKIPSGRINVTGLLLESINTVTGPKAISFNNPLTTIRAVTSAVGSPLFSGFLNNNLNNIVPAPVQLATTGQVEQDGSGNSTTSLAIPVGTNVALLVHTISAGSGLSGPTSLTFNGQAMTKILDETAGDTVTTAWFLALGNLPSGLTANLVVAGNTGSVMRLVTGVAFGNVKQTTPSSENTSFIDTTGTTISDTAFAQIGSGIVSQHIACRRYDYNIRITTTDRVVVDDSNLTFTAYNTLNAGQQSLAINGASDVSIRMQLSSVTLEPATSSVVVQISGVQSGFTGLTVGARYFVNGTGDITTTVGGQYVGRADTETSIILADTSKFVGVKVHQNATSSIPTYNTKTAVSFQVAEFDTDLFFSSVNPTRLTVPFSGMYLIGATVVEAGNNFSVKAILRKDGTTELAVSGFTNDFGVNAGASVSTIAYLEAGSYLEVLTQTQAGTTTTSGDALTNFWIRSI